jgi:hemoglobin-like flavoprotein
MEVTDSGARPGSHIDIIVQSLSAVADREEDITPRVYETYFRRCPDSNALMVGTDCLMRGRMMQEVLVFILSEDLLAQRAYLRFETKTHQDYGVESGMYKYLLMAVRDTVKEVLGPDWREEYQSAWNGRLEELLHEISDALPAT